MSEVKTSSKSSEYSTSGGIFNLSQNDLSNYFGNRASNVGNNNSNNNINDISNITGGISGSKKSVRAPKPGDDDYPFERTGKVLIIMPPCADGMKFHVKYKLTDWFFESKVWIDLLKRDPTVPVNEKFDVRRSKNERQDFIVTKTSNEAFKNTVPDVYIMYSFVDTYENLSKIFDFIYVISMDMTYIHQMIEDLKSRATLIYIRNNRIMEELANDWNKMLDEFIQAGAPADCVVWAIDEITLEQAVLAAAKGQIPKDYSSFVIPRIGRRLVRDIDVISKMRNKLIIDEGESEDHPQLIKDYVLPDNQAEEIARCLALFKRRIGEQSSRLKPSVNSKLLLARESGLTVITGMLDLMLNLNTKSAIDDNNVLYLQSAFKEFLERIENTRKCAESKFNKLLSLPQLDDHV